MRTLTLPRPLAWLTFPISHAEFGAMLDGLLPPFIDVLHTVATSVAAIAITAAVSVRSLPRAHRLRNQSGSHVAENEVMERPRSDHLVGRGTAALADAADPRSTIVAALAANPVYEQSLRRAVWAYVSVERDNGASPGHVILALTELVGAARIAPASVAVALTRQVILWSRRGLLRPVGCRRRAAQRRAAPRRAGVRLQSMTDDRFAIDARSDQRDERARYRLSGHDASAIIGEACGMSQHAAFQRSFDRQRGRPCLEHLPRRQLQDRRQSLSSAVDAAKSARDPVRQSAKHRVGHMDERLDAGTGHERGAVERERFLEHSASGNTIYQM